MSVKPTVFSPRPKKPVRRPLPAELPREVIEHDIPEQDKQCVCGCMKQRIGEEVTEQLEFIPAKLTVIAHVRPKYACNRCDEGVSIASMPQLFLPKSIATPSLVAHTIISKYQDHLPLYRQEHIWKRMGIEMPRNTVCGWIMAAAQVCMPMREALIKVSFAEDDVSRNTALARNLLPLTRTSGGLSHCQWIGIYQKSLSVSEILMQ